MAETPAAESPTPMPDAAAPKWPAASRKMVPIDTLLPYARNSRAHSPEQIDKIAKAMKRFGWTIPVLVDEHGMLLAGHARIQAGKQNGYTEVPVMVAEGWSEDDKRAYIIWDNKSAEDATWIESILRAELTDLQAHGFDLSFTGFGDLELAHFMTAPDLNVQQTRSLAERFGVVPFSVLNAREGWWQDRKRAWIALGLKSEVGRGENLLKFSDAVSLDGAVYKQRAGDRAQGKQQPAPPAAALGGEV